MKKKLREAAIDASVLIDYFNSDQSVINHFRDFSILWIPVPVVAEMEYGFRSLKRTDYRKMKFDMFLSRDDVGIIECDREVASGFADIKALLRKQGAMIPVNDIWIAACCSSRRQLLLTRDLDFKRVPGLDVEML